MTQPATMAMSEAGDEVEGGDLPAEEPVEQHEGDLVDHRRGDEEREGDARAGCRPRRSR